MVYYLATNNTSLLSFRVIFELLWRDYFKFVGVKYGNRLFQVKGEISSNVQFIFLKTL